MIHVINFFRKVYFWFREQVALTNGDLAEAIYWEQERKLL